MTRSIFFKNLWDRKVSTLSTGGSLLAVTWLYAYLFESFSGEITSFEEILPPELTAFLGDVSTASTPEGWLNLEYFQFFYPILISIVAIMTGAAIIGNEEKAGTLELILTRPISRSRIFFEKTLTLWGQMISINLLSFLGVIIGTWMFPFDVDLGRVGLAHVSGTLMALVFGTFAFMLQGIFRKKSLALGVGSAVFGASYIIFAVSQIQESFEWLKHFSLFTYYQAEDILLNEPSVEFFGVLVSLIFVLQIIGMFGFHRRDTGV